MNLAPFLAAAQTYRDAAKAAKAGDYVAVQRILGPFLQSPEANALFGGRP